MATATAMEQAFTNLKNVTIQELADIAQLLKIPTWKLVLILEAAQ